MKRVCMALVIASCFAVQAHEDCCTAVSEAVCNVLETAQKRIEAHEDAAVVIAECIACIDASDADDATKAQLRSALEALLPA